MMKNNIKAEIDAISWAAGLDVELVMTGLRNDVMRGQLARECHYNMCDKFGDCVVSANDDDLQNKVYYSYDGLSYPDDDGVMGKIPFMGSHDWSHEEAMIDAAVDAHKIYKINQ